MYNQRHIEDEYFIKEIETKGEFLYKDDEYSVCNLNDTYYYKYKDKVYRVLRNRETSPEELESIKETVIEALLETAKINGTESTYEDVKDSFKLKFINKVGSVILECVEVNNYNEV